MPIRDPDLALRILNWVLEQQMAGKSPTSIEIAKAFEMTPDEAERIREELEEAGEFD